MVKLLSASVVVLSLFQSALAGVYITNPVSSSNAVGGQVLTVQWADDGNAPTVAQVGPSSIDLYTGSVNQQTFLQNLAASVDVSKTSSISATINPSVGQTGPYYFVRFRSLSLQDSKNPQYNYQAYSAKFDITAMTGTFNATVLAQIDADPNQPSAAAASAQGLQAATASTSKAPASSSTTKPSSGATTNAVISGSAVLIAGLASYLVL